MSRNEGGGGRGGAGNDRLADINPNSPRFTRTLADFLSFYSDDQQRQMNYEDMEALQNVVSPVTAHAIRQFVDNLRDFQRINRNRRAGQDSWKKIFILLFVVLAVWLWYMKTFLM